MQETSEIQKIKNSDRQPIKNIDNVIVELNEIASKCQNQNIKIHWSIGLDAFGSALHAKITFKSPKDCIEFAQHVSNLQEAADHHSNFKMSNFETVDILLSTHRPIPGITMVDVQFAKYISAMTFSNLG